MKAFEEVLVFVAGASPQIITETIYALSTKKKPIHPDRIYIITTTTGKNIIEKHLLEEGKLKALLEEYNLPSVSIEDNSFLIPRNAAGEPIDDIKTSEDNEALAELITSFIREISKDHQLRLHCSIAGGRKTMSFYLGAALQLFGRPWDKLYHVIVSPEFESHPDFFYIPKANQKLTVRTPDGKTRTVNTSEAKIYLADLPFIRLGHKLRLKSASFKELVAEGQKEIELSWLQPEINVELSSRRVHTGHSFFILSPILMFIYCVFLKQKLSGCQRPARKHCQDCTDCYIEVADLFSPDRLVNYQPDFLRIHGNQEHRWLTFNARWRNGIPPEVTRQYISKINRQIENQIPEESLNSLCKISSLRIYAGTRYGVRIDKNKIQFIGSSNAD